MTSITAQHVLKDGVVPRELVLGNANYRPEMVGFDVPCGTYIHICGIDIVRDDAGRFMVLEDNGRTPSGVSYVVENRRIMQRAFPDLIDVFIRPVEDYGLRLGAGDDARSRRPASTRRRSSCCRRASTTRPISSMSSWPARWACRWSRAATSWSRTTASS